jgi:hypothetical protein
MNAKQVIGRAQYWEGYYKWGMRTARGYFVSYPTHLAFEASGGVSLSFPWMNLVEFSGGAVKKRLVGRILTAIFGWLPIVEMTSLGRQMLRGFRLTYKDQELMREVSIFFVIDNPEYRDWLVNEIWRHRDHYIAWLSQNAGPERR